MSVAAIRAGIAANLGTVKGLRVSSDMPDQVNPPIAVLNLQSVNYDGAFANGLTVYNFSVTVIVGRASEREAQRRIDSYITPGAGSIKSAIESDKQLGGAAYDVRVENMSNFGSILISDQTYLAADFTVTVYGN